VLKAGYSAKLITLLKETDNPRHSDARGGAPESPFKKLRSEYADGSDKAAKFETYDF